MWFSALLLFVPEFSGESFQKFSELRITMNLSQIHFMGKVEGQGESWHGHVTAVTVAPEYRKHQLATKLMNILEYITDKILSYVCSSSDHFNILDHGAINNIINDSSQAFLDAWRLVCNSEVDNTTLFNLRWRTFIVNPIVFTEPCKPNIMNFQVRREIVATPSPSAWEKQDPSQWLAFKEVRGCRVSGSGMVNGQGFG
ncbi:hypothetical protein BVRB_2g033800 [Beta vulgaris subsp. vulgaris]|nr:hypothetical protein BVRB_2g033800 [Beta vulgaris subsp. vulgaris]